MSIINEALKKAGKERSSLDPIGAYRAEYLMPALEPGLKKNKASFNWGPLFVISVLLLITGPIIAPFFSAPFKRGELPTTVTVLSDKTQNSAPRADLNRKEQFAVEETPVFQPAASPFAQPPYLTLSGIVYSPNDAYCIINDKIVKTGESIQDARLLSITESQVVLDFNGQKMTLNLSK